MGFGSLPAQILHFCKKRTRYLTFMYDFVWLLFQAKNALRIDGGLWRFRFGTNIAMEPGLAGCPLGVIFRLSVDLYQFFVFHIALI